MHNSDLLVSTCVMAFGFSCLIVVFGALSVVA